MSFISIIKNNYSFIFSSYLKKNINVYNKQTTINSSISNIIIKKKNFSSSSSSIGIKNINIKKNILIPFVEKNFFLRHYSDQSKIKKLIIIKMIINDSTTTNLDFSWCYSNCNLFFKNI